MEGFYPCLPLNPLHPLADDDTVAAGFKKQSLITKDKCYLDLINCAAETWCFLKQEITCKREVRIASPRVVGLGIDI